MPTTIIVISSSWKVLLIEALMAPVVSLLTRTLYPLGSGAEARLFLTASTTATELESVVLWTETSMTGMPLTRA